MSESATTLETEGCRLRPVRDWLAGGYLCGPGTEDVELGAKVSAYCRAKREAKSAEAKAAEVEGEIKERCEALWVGMTLAGEDGVVRLVNAFGRESVTYVVQDRSASSPLKVEQANALSKAIGLGHAYELIDLKTRIRFDELILSKRFKLPRSRVERSVLNVVLCSIQGAIDDLVSKGALSADEARSLLQLEHDEVLRPGFARSLSSICGRDASCFKAAIRAVGSAITRFLKVA